MVWVLAMSGRKSVSSGQRAVLCPCSSTAMANGGVPSIVARRRGHEGRRGMTLMASLAPEEDGEGANDPVRERDVGVGGELSPSSAEPPAPLLHPPCAIISR